jgi:extradiol dioxygenase family protein
VSVNISNSKKRMSPFHIVIQARDMHEARHFYANALGCRECRSDGTSINFNLYGHHLVCHLNIALGKSGKVASHYHPRDRDGLPVPRYGVFLEIEEWHDLAERLVGHSVDFMIEPSVRFEGRPEEEGIMVLLDPSGNGLEFKSVRQGRYEIYTGAA